MRYLAAISLLFTAANIASAGPIGRLAQSIQPATLDGIYTPAPLEQDPKALTRRAFAALPRTLDAGFIRSLDATQLEQLKDLLYNAQSSIADDQVGLITTETIRAIDQSLATSGSSASNDDVYHYLENLMLYVSRQVYGYESYRVLLANLCAGTLPQTSKPLNTDSISGVNSIRQLTTDQLRNLLSMLSEAYIKETQQTRGVNPGLEDSTKASVSLIKQAIDLGRVNNPQALFNSLEQLRQQVNKTPGKHSAFEAFFASF